MEHSLAQLKAIAFGYDVEIGGLRSKADITAALADARVPGFSAVCAPVDARSAFVALQAAIDETTHPYAELVPLLAYVRPLLSRFGLALQADPVSPRDQVGFRLHVIHGASGTELVFEPVMFPNGTNVRTRAAAVDVAKWVAITSALNMSAPDHDRLTAEVLSGDKVERKAAAPKEDAGTEPERRCSRAQQASILRRTEDLELTADEAARVVEAAGADPRKPASELTAKQASLVIDALGAMQAARRAREARRP